ncbi:hypothetical protein LY76DRAFT_287291 [Colletotrichum caudatum]|nr:hypothetical protein LY76DRAFT_287291 [Colletotrichum caudatum]
MSPACVTSCLAFLDWRCSGGSHRCPSSYICMHVLALIAAFNWGPSSVSHSAFQGLLAQLAHLRFTPADFSAFMVTPESLGTPPAAARLNRVCARTRMS